MKKTLSIGVMLLWLLFIAGCGKNTTTTSWSELLWFADCLNKAGAIFYGTERCPHCKNQKELFGVSMEKVNYIDCDKQSALCQAAGITWYPTWKFADGSVLQGTQPLEALASKTNCSMSATDWTWS